MIVVSWDGSLGFLFINYEMHLHSLKLIIVFFKSNELVYKEGWFIIYEFFWHSLQLISCLKKVDTILVMKKRLLFIIMK